MQNYHLLTLISVVLVSLLLTACGDKVSEQKAVQAVEKSAAPQTTAMANKVVGADAHPGKALHDANCISCHDTKVYTRVERKVLDYTQLAAQVRRCDANLGSRLFDEDLAHITDYLNQAYYKYPKQ